MKTILFTLAAGTAIAATPAMAQGTGPAGSFQGFHIEALGGYDITQAGSTVDDDSAIDNDQSIEGFTYGIGAGYDIRIGDRFVVGPEAELTWSTAETEFEDGDWEGFGLGHVKTNRDLYIGARAGFIVNPKTLVYLKGGYTNAKFDVRNGLEGTIYEKDVDADGWRIGAGVERAVTDNVFAKLEYRYSNYEQGQFDYTADIPDSSEFGLDLDRHQIMAGVGVRF